MRKSQEEACIFWPLGFWAGDVCTYGGDASIADAVVVVVSAFPEDIPPGYVPVILANKKRKDHPPINVLAENLYLYGPKIEHYPSRKGSMRGDWGMDFFADELLTHKGRCAHVVTALPEDVPIGYIPIRYKGDPTDAEVHFVPLDDVDSPRLAL